MKTLMILTMMAALAGCATIDGVGQDISGGARTVQSWF
ncbi:entericidin EcnA/B family protein [Thalassococcus profundi]|uniref:Entericidin EcnA/B family protein n=1 Tax=Thalassococcus profundi TaxID=2282382 RepID=A0A369TQB9_9RHOB|nr:entericidin EcnA/B family protein [Thalassococcus profundi]RDD66904.1 entericidin EcnA/B family protein [Thalassococcus profundi]